MVVLHLYCTVVDMQHARCSMRTYQSNTPFVWYGLHVCCCPALYGSAILPCTTILKSVVGSIVQGMREGMRACNPAIHTWIDGQVSCD